MTAGRDATTNGSNRALEEGDGLHSRALRTWPLPSARRMVRSAKLTLITQFSYYLVFKRRHSEVAVRVTAFPSAEPPDVHHIATHQRPGSRYRGKKFLRVSPNAILALRIRLKEAPLTWEEWCLLRDVSRSGSRRLPVVTLQMMLRKDEERMQTPLSNYLAEPAEWRSRLNSLAFKGISKDDIDHWVWILSAPDGDSRIERFVSTNRLKPAFVLLRLLGRDETFNKGRSLMSLLDYIAQHHVQWRTTLEGPQLPVGALRRTLDGRLNMTTMHFSMLLRLLVHHFLRVWPSALPALARLVAAYIDSIRPTGGDPAAVKAYRDRCLIFNYALQLLQRRSPASPVSEKIYNWRAQKILLAHSNQLPRPLVIDRETYRAIRRVMLALPKSQAEAKLASRLVKTWPPYQQRLDGLDEKRQPEEATSRSVMAGLLMGEAGYPDQPHDRALSTLGGGVANESPTVQTRSLSPRTWTGRNASLNIFSEWAARVKATRNAWEAWRMFKSHPAPGIRPNFQVYAEMFEKLHARPASAHSPPIPGDAKEVFPVHDANLSSFEKARTDPPTVERLYRCMLEDGSRPVQNCLLVLVKNADSLDRAGRYLRDGGISACAVDALWRWKYADSPERLKEIPLQVFTAYISLLCRLQPRVGDGRGLRTKMDQTNYVQRALWLTESRLPPTSADGRRYSGPWRCIMRTLATPRLLVNRNRPFNRHFQDGKALSMLLTTVGKVRDRMGLDVVLFECLCNATRKCLRSAASSTGPIGTAGQGDNAPIADAHSLLVAFFRSMTTESSKPREAAKLGCPSLRHKIEAVQIDSYMQVLALLGDTDEMIRVLDWVLDACHNETVLERAKDPYDRQHDTMDQVLTFFRAATEKQVPDDEMRRLEGKLVELNHAHGCTWSWPTSEQVEAHIRMDHRREGQEFWTRARSPRGTEGPHETAFQAASC